MLALGIWTRACSIRAAIYLIALLITGCAAPRAHTGAEATLFNQTWTGRLSLQIQSEPPQAFFIGFELKGTSQNGELKLTNPIGSTVGILHWSANEAVLESGRGDTRKSTSIEAMLQQVTGAAVPVHALFDWLEGKNTSPDGWRVDLSEQPEGKISAKRTLPAPQIDLRVVLDK